jgi:aspartate carbamoyltransferase catalytic subunit
VYRSESSEFILDRQDQLTHGLFHPPRERFENVAEYEAVKDLYIINNEVLTRAKPSAIVMHPLPRNNEIDPEVDFDSRRAAYFRQMRYGLFVSPFCLL